MIGPRHQYLKCRSLLKQRRVGLRSASVILLSGCLLIFAASHTSGRASPQNAAVPGGSTIPISDIIGLTEELQLRAEVGTNYVPGRTAVINPEGQIDGAQGNPSDCVHVDGSSGPCDVSTGTGSGLGSGPSQGSGGVAPGSNFSDNEVPQGSLDGQNRIFIVTRTPNPPSSLHVYYNGLRLTPGVDYGLSGMQLLWLRTYAPQPSDSLITDYRY